MKAQNNVWPLVRLHQVIVDMQPGFAQRPNLENIGIPQLRTNNISPQGTVDLTDLINVIVSPTELEKYAVQKGDVIFNNTNSVEWVGKTTCFNGEGDYVLSNHMTRIRVNTTVLDPDFLARYLHYLWQIGSSGSRAKQWVNQAAIDQTMLAQFEVPLPPLAEQRSIVSILRQADRLRQLRRETEEKAQQLLPALFYEMFDDPHSWRETTTLGELVDFVGGGTPSRKVEEYFTGNIPWATSKDIKTRYLDDAQEHVTEKAIRESATNLVPAGTILLVVKSKILLHSLPVSITTRPFCFGQDVKGLVPKPGIEPIFIVSSLLAQSDSILRSARGVNTEGLTLDILRDITVPFVDTPQQKSLIESFVEKVNVYDHLEKATRSANQNITTLFLSLLAQAFSGELTAKWREEHEGLESIQGFPEIELLRPVEGKGLRVVEETVAETIEKVLGRADVVAELSDEQQQVLDLVHTIKGYCTVETLKASSNLPVHVIRQGLQFLTRIGLIQALRLPDRPIRNVVYVPVYRALDDGDLARTPDIGFLQQSLQKEMAL